jgi:sugar O-acyltransferase (sialic acid O-acetyltransferase NeuD family)
MPENNIVLVGGGGHCASVIDVIEREGRFSIAGIVDRQNIGKKVLGYTIIASDSELPRLAKEYRNFLVTVGHIESNEARTRFFDQLKKLGNTFPTIISPLAYVSKHATVGEGTVVMHNAFVNANAKVGKNTIINTAAIIEHDATIGDHCHVSTAGVVNGGCTIGDHTFVGSNAMIKQYLSIGDRVIIGASSVVLNNLERNGLYAGNPAVLKRKVD